MATSSTLIILADGDNPERAVELYSMLMQDPLCAASRWLVDSAAPHVTAAMDALTAGQIEAALSRGKALEKWETATALLDEVTRLGWLA